MQNQYRPANAEFGKKIWKECAMDSEEDYMLRIQLVDPFVKAGALQRRSVINAAKYNV